MILPTTKRQKIIATEFVEQNNNCSSTLMSYLASTAISPNLLYISQKMTPGLPPERLCAPWHPMAILNGMTKKNNYFDDYYAVSLDKVKRNSFAMADGLYQVFKITPTPLLGLSLSSTLDSSSGLTNLFTQKIFRGVKNKRSELKARLQKFVDFSLSTFNNDSRYSPLIAFTAFLQSGSHDPLVIKRIAESIGTELKNNDSSRDVDTQKKMAYLFLLARHYAYSDDYVHSPMMQDAVGELVDVMLSPKCYFHGAKADEKQKAIAQFAFEYSSRHPDSRHEKLERAIAGDLACIVNYAGLHPGFTFDAGERAILAHLSNDTYEAIGFAIEYNSHVKKGRWPDLENVLLEQIEKGADSSNRKGFRYWEATFNGSRWPAYEAACINRHIEFMDGDVIDGYVDKCLDSDLAAELPAEFVQTSKFYGISTRAGSDGLLKYAKSLSAPSDLIETKLMRTFVPTINYWGTYPRPANVDKTFVKILSEYIKNPNVNAFTWKTEAAIAGLIYLSITDRRASVEYGPELHSLFDDFLKKQPGTFRSIFIEHALTRINPFCVGAKNEDADTAPLINSQIAEKMYLKAAKKEAPLKENVEASDFVSRLYNTLDPTSKYGEKNSDMKNLRVDGVINKSYISIDETAKNADFPLILDALEYKYLEAYGKEPVPGKSFVLSAVQQFPNSNFIRDIGDEITPADLTQKSMLYYSAVAACVEAAGNLRTGLPFDSIVLAQEHKAFGLGLLRTQKVAIDPLLDRANDSPAQLKLSL